MGILLLSLAIAGTVGAAAGFVIFWIAKRYGKPTLGGFCAIAVAVVLAYCLLMPIAEWLRDATTTTLIAMNPREGEKRLGFIGLPPNTTNDFCYRHSAVGVTVLADFDMSESDFLAWMDSQSWRAVKFSLGPNETSFEWPDGGVTSVDPTVYPVRQYDSQTPLEVKRGYCFYTSKPDNPDNTTTIIYDSDSGRAYVTLTTY